MGIQRNGNSGTLGLNNRPPANVVGEPPRGVHRERWKSARTWSGSNAGASQDREPDHRGSSGSLSDLGGEPPQASRRRFDIDATSSLAPGGAKTVGPTAWESQTSRLGLFETLRAKRRATMASRPSACLPAAFAPGRIATTCGTFGRDQRIGGPSRGHPL